MPTTTLLDAEQICADLADCYNDDTERALAQEVAETLCGLATQQTVVRVGYIGRLRHLPDGLTDDVLNKLNDKERALLADLEHISLIDSLHENPLQNIERLRQMLLAMANDVRVVIIKLALQLVAMRHLDYYPAEKRHQLALQTRDIQAPLANRLGIAKLKWELEDLALRELEPTTYRLIASSLAEQRRQREDYVNNVVTQLQQIIADEHIKTAKVYGRAKHINSIFNKMKKKHKHLEEIYDLIAVRVQVATLKDCYTVLGLVHATWQHIPSEFDDYIANPKPNGYQSLHTAVVGPDNKTIEVQIRTHEMHDYAELGVAAHWRYKENSTGKVSAFEKQINWLRALLNASDEAIADEFTAEITEDRVYVVTPQAKVIELPSGSTPLDFAYHIHTDLGHRTKGAKINGQLVPLTQPLTTGDTVEVLTGPKKQPGRDWLNPHSGYLKSSRARAKVRHFFKQQGREHAIAEGQEMLEKHLAKLGIKSNQRYLKKTAEKFNIKNIENLYAALGFGDLGIVSVVNYIDEIREDKQQHLDDITTRLARIPIRKANKNKQNVIIEDLDDLLISMASCCAPVPPEPIIGYITKTKGIRIHKNDCPNVLHLADAEPEKIMPVNWAMNDNGFNTTIHIQATDRVGLIRDISQALVNEDVTIQKANFARDDDENVNMQLQISIRNTEQLAKALKKINQLKNIRSANRVTTT